MERSGKLDVGSSSKNGTKCDEQFQVAFPILELRSGVPVCTNILSFIVFAQRSKSCPREKRVIYSIPQLKKSSVLGAIARFVKIFTTDDDHSAVCSRCSPECDTTTTTQANKPARVTEWSKFYKQKIFEARESSAAQRSVVAFFPFHSGRSKFRFEEQKKTIYLPIGFAHTNFQTAPSNLGW